MELNYNTKGASRNYFLLVLALILAVMIFAFMNSNSLSQFRIIEVVSGHAYEAHGVEVNTAIKCLNDGGSTKSFKTSGFTDDKGNLIPTNMWLCFDGKDWYAVVTTTFQRIFGNKVARLVTAYKVAKDTFPEIDDFIAYITLKWSATPINYYIEPGNIILQPK